MRWQLSLLCLFLVSIIGLPVVLAFDLYHRSRGRHYNDGYAETKQQDDHDSTQSQPTGTSVQEEECSSGMDDTNGDGMLQEFPVFINDDLTIQLLQASSAFSGVEHDETGTVLWGASVCLARYLSPDILRMGQQEQQSATTVLELGCGCGLPSIVAAKYGASRVMATDMEAKTLQQLDQVAILNNCQDKLELYQMNWYDSIPTTEKGNDEPPDFQADIVMASDVIYADAMVTPLVHTVRKYLKPGGKAYFSLRNTREGVQPFWQEAMPQAGFVLVETIPCAEYLAVRGDQQLPPGFQQESQGHRWRGDHTIYVFQRQEQQQGGDSATGL